MTTVQHRGVVALFFVALVVCSDTTINAQLPHEKVDLDVISRIRSRESQQSEIMQIVGYLTDVTGPRLTGSPNLKKAQQYVLERLHEWGAANAHLEGWGTFALEPLDTGRSRLIARGGVRRGVAAAAYGLLMEIPHFLMERRMLLGIKQRAEANSRMPAPAS